MSSTQSSENNLIETEQDGIKYSLDEEKKIAFVLNLNIKNDIFIPRSIVYNSQEYIITGIRPKAFNGIRKVHSVSFAESSEVKIIEPNAFFSYSINSITLPPSVTQIKDGWCSYAPSLSKIKVDPNNQYYKSYQDQFIFAKSSPEQENFNVLIFSVSQIQIATIPDYIEIFGPRAFYICDKLSQITLSPNSNLKIIENEVFSYSSIESFTIPASVVEIKEEWCKNATKLKVVKVDPNNKRYSNYDDKFVIGKSSIDQENFDVLLFCFRNVEKVTIPDFIEVISPYSFSRNELLQQVEISSNSKLQTIERGAFSSTNIKNFTIPSQLVKIGERAFYYCEKLNEFKIPQNSCLKIIEKEAFSYTKIENIEINSSVVELKKGWNRYMSNLKTVKIDSNNKNYSNYEDKLIIGKSMINQDNFNIISFCSKNLSEITIPDFIEIIPLGTFEKFTNLTEVKFSPNSKLRIIEKNAFTHSTIMSILIPSSVIKIDQNAFYNCLRLEKAEIPEDSQLQEIGLEAFAHSAICKIFIPFKITQINEGTFYHCKSLSNIEFAPNSQLRIIEKEAFAYTGIISLIIPPLVEKINEGAFYFSKLTKIDIPSNSNLQLIGENAFYRNLFESISLPVHLKKINENVFSPCYYLKTIEIPENSELKIIERNAFQRTLIQEIFIPANTDLQYGCFSYAYKLTNIKISANNKNYKSDEGKFVYAKSSDKIENFDVFFYSFLNVEEITIPEFIEIIAPYAFEGCINLRSVKIPFNSKLRIIKHCAFRKCKKLQFFEISENSNLQIIENGAFAECENLERFTIQSNSKLNIIKHLAFYKCKKLQFFEIPENSNLQIIGNGAFAECENLERFTIQSNSKLNKIENSAFYKCKKLQFFEIPENSNLQTIEGLVFFNTSIQELTIPSSVIDLKDGCFACTPMLTKINISPNNRKYKLLDNKIIIGKSSIEQNNFDILLFCFKDAKKIEIPDSIETIHSYAFQNCKELKHVKMSRNSKLRIIGKQSFDHNPIEKISFPSTLTHIDDEAFGNCLNLQFVDFPPDSQLQIIESYAFKYAPLKSLSLPQYVRKIKNDAFYGCDDFQIFEINDNSELSDDSLQNLPIKNTKIIMISRNVSDHLINAFINIDIRFL